MWLLCPIVFAVLVLSTTATRTNVVVGSAFNDDALVNKSAGTEFWLAFPPNFELPDVAYEVLISGMDGTYVSVRVPRRDFDANVTLSRGNVATVTLPLSPEADRMRPEGVRVIADAPVVVYGSSTSQGSSDAYLALPDTVLKTKYRILDWPVDSGAAQMTIIATENETKVNTSREIIELEAGQVYVEESARLSGRLITSNKKIGVLGGHRCGNVPDSTAGYCDHLIHMIPPLYEWKRRVVVAPFATRTTGDVVHLITKNDNTTVYVDGEKKLVMQAGDSTRFELPSDHGSVINATGPFLAAQLMKGLTVDRPGRNEDPSSLLLLAPTQYLTAYKVSTIFLANNYLNLIVHRTGLASIRLDGIEIPATSYQSIPMSRGYLYTQVSVEPGTHNVTGSIPFGLSVYGFADASSYAFPGGAKFPR